MPLLFGVALVILSTSLSTQFSILNEHKETARIVSRVCVSDKARVIEAQARRKAIYEIDNEVMKEKVGSPGFRYWLGLRHEAEISLSKEFPEVDPRICSDINVTLPPPAPIITPLQGKVSHGVLPAR
jgi:hypothetical protein